MVQGNGFKESKKKILKNIENHKKIKMVFLLVYLPNILELLIKIKNILKYLKKLMSNSKKFYLFLLFIALIQIHLMIKYIASNMAKYS